MPRSLKKGPYVDTKLLKKVGQARKLSEKEKEKLSIKTYSRDSMITPDMIGLSFSVYNGKTFIAFKAREEMVGHRLGEFAHTRKFTKHGGKLQREVEAKQTGAATPAPATGK